MNPCIVEEISLSLAPSELGRFTTTLENDLMPRCPSRQVVSLNGGRHHPGEQIRRTGEARHAEGGQLRGDCLVERGGSGIAQGQQAYRLYASADDFGHAAHELLLIA